jgi:Periplasmic component of the Tol biopolymer transport system
LERIVLRALEKDRELRYQTASDLRAELKLLRREREPPRIPAAGLARYPPSRRSQPRRFTLALVLGGASLAALGTYVLTMHEPARPFQRATFARLTNQPGPEIYPSLSPDGNLLVYQSRATGKWDIYLQKIGGSNAVNLTKDSSEDDTQPAFSPDGERVAFRSERDGGGIFLMGATGENVKRLTDFGFNPAWSPDGTEIVCSTGSFLNRPEERGTSRHGQLFRINVASGQSRVIPGNIDDAVEPHWSPHGHRVAYWGIVGGARRDLWTVAASGGDPVRVTDDPYVDWNPVWSVDGRYLYFSSDRNGSMNLWRIPIDEVSGKSLADPEPVTTPSLYSGFLSFSRDGRRLAYAQQVHNWNMYKMRFDPEKEAAEGRPEAVTRGSSEAVYPDVSPDGQWIAFTTRVAPEDVYVVKTDGSGLRKLTDDVYQYAIPRWSPDGRQIAFFSNRSGSSQIWTIRPDGGGLEQLTDAPSGCQTPVWSPDGKRLVCTRFGEMPLILETGKSWKDQVPQALPAPGEPDASFSVWSWSPDGLWLAGSMIRKDGRQLGTAIYSFESRKYERFLPSRLGGNWLRDSRRLLFEFQGKLHLLDTQSKRRREVFSVTPYEILPQFRLSPDNRFIVFTLDSTESDIWLMKFE